VAHPSNMPFLKNMNENHFPLKIQHALSDSFTETAAVHLLDVASKLPLQITLRSTSSEYVCLHEFYALCNVVYVYSNIL